MKPFLALNFAFLFGAAGVYAAPAAQEFRVTDVAGKVAVIPKGKTTASPAVKGLPVAVGDRFITGEKGRLEVAAKEGTVLELQEKSYFRVQNLTPGKSSFFLKVGRLLGRFAPAKETGTSYRIATPVVVAAVRGTDLGVAVAEDGETQGGVVEGAVDFKKPKYGPAATMNWSDDDPRLSEEEEDASAPPAALPTETPVVESTPTAAAPSGETPVSVKTGEGISVKPNAAPEKLSTIPPVAVPDVAWFTSVRDRVPKLRDEWKDLDVPSKMKMRQQALRERITWQIPAKLQPPKPAANSVHPEKVSPKKHDIPKPK